jgi:hypothetical protein
VIVDAGSSPDIAPWPAQTGCQSRSSSIAMPWPPPMQRLTSPSCRSLRSISPRILVVMIAPVAAIGWPSAIAPPFGLTFARSSSRSWQTARDWAANALVELDDIDVVERLAGPLERLAHGGHGPDPHRFGLHPTDRVRDDPSSDRCAQLLRTLPRHDNDRCGGTLTPEALPAVTAPSFLKAGLSFAKSPSVASRRRCSSTLNSVVPTRVLSSIDTTSSSNRPVSIAA